MTRLDCAFDEVTHPRIGLLVLQSDYTLEDDMRRLLPAGASILTARVPNEATITPDTLAAMKDVLPDAASRFPTDAVFDAVGYGCTSGTSTIGAAAVAEQVRRGCRARQVTDPVTALIAACRALGIARLALVSPYMAEVNETLRRTLFKAGIETPVFGSFEESDDTRVARIAADAIAAATVKLAGEGGVDAIFLSCTNLRTLDLIAALEARIGMPVLSSNQVMAWHLAQLAGVRVAPGFGRLTDQTARN